MLLKIQLFFNNYKVTSSDYNSDLEQKFYRNYLLKKYSTGRNYHHLLKLIMIDLTLKSLILEVLNAHACTIVTTLTDAVGHIFLLTNQLAAVPFN